MELDGVRRLPALLMVMRTTEPVKRWVTKTAGRTLASNLPNASDLLPSSITKYILSALNSRDSGCFSRDFSCFSGLTTLVHGM